MRGYRLKLKLKKLLKAKGYDPKDFLLIKKSADNIKLLEKSTGKILNLQI